MTTAIVLGLVAALGWGVVDLASALAGRRIGSLRVQVGTLLASCVTLLPVVLLLPGELGVDPIGAVAAGVPAGVLMAVGYLAYFTALRLGPISVVSPIVVTYGGLGVVLAVLLRGESLSGLQATGAILATGGVALISMSIEPGAARAGRANGPGILLAIVTVAVFAVLALVLAGPIRDRGWLPVLVGSRIGNLGAGAALLTLARVSRAPVLGPLLHPALPLDRRVGATVVAGGIADTVATVGFSVGLGSGPVWPLILLSSLGPVIVIAYALARLGERLRPTQWLGVAGVISGVALLGLAG